MEVRDILWKSPFHHGPRDHKQEVKLSGECLYLWAIWPGLFVANLHSTALSWASSALEIIALKEIKCHVNMGCVCVYVCVNAIASL